MIKRSLRVYGFNEWINVLNYGFNVVKVLFTASLCSGVCHATYLPIPSSRSLSDGGNINPEKGIS
jgi:hypothetical protein